MSNNRKGESRNKAKNKNWNPKGGLILKQIEFDRRIINALRDIGEADGVKSVYQMIRNACYRYVQMRNGKESATANAVVGTTCDIKDGEEWHV